MIDSGFAARLFDLALDLAERFHDPCAPSGAFVLLALNDRDPARQFGHAGVEMTVQRAKSDSQSDQLHQEDGDYVPESQLRGGVFIHSTNIERGFFAGNVIRS